ncbi:Signal transducer and activator of transcription 5B [Nymphon striatum]|nr:Signal transducer and activator of transcription 5B [Nymphon striatum]
MVKWFTLATVYHPLAKMEWEPGLKSCLYSQSNQFNAMLVNACHQLKYFTTVNQFDESTVHSQSNQPSRQITQIHRTLRSDNNWTPPSFSTAANQASSLSPSILLDKLLPLLLAKLLISKHPAGQTSSSAEGSSPATGLCSATSNFVDIAQQLDILREKTQESDHNLRSMQQEQEKFVIQYQESSKLAAMSSQKRKVPENGDVSRKTARCSAQQVAAILESDDEETLGFDEDYPSDELKTDSDDNVENDNDSESDSDNENPVDRLPVRLFIGHNLDSGWNKKYVGVNPRVNKHLGTITAHLQQIENHGSGQANPEDVKKIQRQKVIIDNILSNQAQAILKQRVDLIRFYADTFSLITSLQSHVVDDILIRWKHEQQQSGNSGVFNNNLDQIQHWCGALADIIWQNRQQIKKIEILQSQLPINTPGSADELPQLNNKITALLSNLVTSTFVIEKQPPQVMKTNTRFTATVRLLVGHELNVYMSPPQVTVTIISEAQANNILKNENCNKNEVSGEILNNIGTMEYHQATKQLSVSFRNMQLRKIKRAEKKGTESVMDEKFALLFQSQFKVGGGELVFRVWTLSLPVVVIVHGNQEPHAWATVSWDNAFAEPGRVPFAVPEKVAWGRVAEALKCKFRSACGGELSEDNIRYLAGKAFRKPEVFGIIFFGNDCSTTDDQMQDYTNMMLSWQLFCKEPLPERNFTFWEWFYAIMKVTREHLRNLWNDGKITGFVSRARAQEMCQSQGSGSFLLRYSDSELGGITIAWVADDKFFMLQPFTIRDFTIRTLADRISDLKHLTHLYPGIPTDQAFSKYYTPFTDNQSTASNGYVKPLLVTQIPGLPSAGSSMGSYPNTPQMLHGPQSPDSVYLTSDNQSVCSPSNEPMAHSGAAAPDMECDLLNMDLISDDIPVDFSSINVSDLIVYSKPNL